MSTTSETSHVFAECTAENNDPSADD